MKGAKGIRQRILIEADRVLWEAHPEWDNGELPYPGIPMHLSQWRPKIQFIPSGQSLPRLDFGRAPRALSAFRRFDIPNPPPSWLPKKLRKYAVKDVQLYALLWGANRHQGKQHVVDEADLKPYRRCAEAEIKLMRHIERVRARLAKSGGADSVAIEGCYGYLRRYRDFCAMGMKCIERAVARHARSDSSDVYLRGGNRGRPRSDWLAWSFLTWFRLCDVHKLSHRAAAVALHPFLIARLPRGSGFCTANGLLREMIRFMHRFGLKVGRAMVSRDGKAGSESEILARIMASHEERRCRGMGNIVRNK